MKNLIWQNLTGGYQTTQNSINGQMKKKIKCLKLRKRHKKILNPGEK
jgi:hypothetical protein